MQIYYPDVPDLPVPEGHRFPVSKYRLLLETLKAPGRLGGATLVPSPMADRELLLSLHDAAYVDSMLAGTASPAALRDIGLPWSEILIRRSRATVGGTLAAARSALRDGFSGQLAGGTHHAHRGFGSGFCVFNDCAIAAHTVLTEGTIARIAIVDLDVHQGDGNSSLLNQNPDVFILSLHGAKNFPFHRVPSTLDVELADGTDDTAYMAALTDALPAVSAFKPDLVLYIAGVDPLREDRLGRLALSRQGLIARDAHVFETFKRQGVPVAVVAGGGYADPIQRTVDAYANTYDCARRIYGF